MLMATARQQQQQHCNSPPSGSGSEHKTRHNKKEIYHYSAPWKLYGINWSVRPDRRFRIAVGSFIEDYSNKFIVHYIGFLSKLIYKCSIVCFLGSLALGKNLVQALPCVYTLQCLTGKVDNHDVY